LIDFGTAKEIDERTTTIIGTPHYMAPEVVLGEGYGNCIDYWSISVCLYEFMCCKVPFGDTYEDPLDIYSAIINDELTFPTYIKDNSFKTTMKSMLNKKLVSRLCSLDQIKNSSWFSDFEWVRIYLMCLG
jgi:cGMP-dependent protein kinase